MEWWELTACLKVYLKVGYKVPAEVQNRLFDPHGSAIEVCQNRDMP